MKAFLHVMLYLLRLYGPKKVCGWWCFRCFSRDWI